MPSASGIRSGKAYLEIGTDDNPLTSGLARAQSKLKAFGASISGFGLKMFGFGDAILGMLGGAATVFTEMGNALAQASARTGVTVEALSELGYAARQSGTDAEALETGLRKMQKSISEAAQGSDEANQALAQLGLTVADLNGLTPDQQFEKLATAISKVKDPSKRAGEAMAIFGKGGADLLPLLSRGAEGIDALRKRADALGLTFTTTEATAAADFHARLEDLWDTLKAGTAHIGAALIPSLRSLTIVVTNGIVKVTDFVKSHQDLIVTIAKVAAGITVAGGILIGVGAAFSTVGGIVGTVGAAISTVTGVFGSLGAILTTVAFSGIGLVIGGLTALGGYFLYASGAGKTFIGDIMSGFASMAGYLDTAFGSWSGFTTSVLTVWHQMKDGMQGVWITFKGWLSGIWEEMKMDFPNVVYGWGREFGKFAGYLVGAMRSAAAAVLDIWNQTVDEVAALMAKHEIKSQAEKDVMSKYDGKTLTTSDTNALAQQSYAPQLEELKKKIAAELAAQGLTGKAFADAMTQQFNAQAKPIIDSANKAFEAQYAGKKLNDDQLQRLVDKETEIRLQAATQSMAADRATHEAEYKARMQGINEILDAQLKAVDDWADKGLAKTPEERFRDAEAAKAKIEKERTDLMEKAKKDLADDLAKLKGMPSFSAELKKLTDEFLHGPAGTNVPPPVVPHLPNTDDMNDMLNKSIGIAGTFNGSALFGLGGGGPGERIAKATEDNAVQTRKLGKTAGDILRHIQPSYFS